MNKEELISMLEEFEEDEVLIMGEDEYLCDFKFKHIEEQFDGFETAYPACIALVAKGGVR